MPETEIIMRDGSIVRAGKLPERTGGTAGRFRSMFKAAQAAYQQGGIPPAISAAYAEWMSPLAPLSPTVPIGTQTRIVDFPVGYNIAWVPRTYEGIGFDQLRAMADNDYIARACIETVKDQLSKVTWRIGLKPKDDIPHVKAKKDSDDDPRVKKLREFFLCPDGIHNWNDWMRLLFEDMLVGDCASLLVARENNGAGAIKWLIPADGGLFHVCIDKRGMRPAPPLPAYQQIVKGQIVANLTTRDLVYMPRNIRTHRIYGMSPVEQLLFFANIVIRRDISKLSYYTVGNVPEALIAAPAHWTQDQIKQFQEWLDSVLSGQVAARRKMTMVPSLADVTGKGGNIRDAVMFTKEAVLQDEFDEWRARVTCYFFSLPPTSFVKMNNRATAQQQQKEALEQGLESKKLWFKDKIDQIIQGDDYFGYKDIECQPEDEPEVDQKIQADVDKINVSVGLRGIDELRIRDGLEPWGIGPMIITASGPIMIDDIKSGEGRVLPNKPQPLLPPGAPPNGKGGKPLSASPAAGGNGKPAQKMLATGAKKKIQITSDPAKLPEKSRRRASVAARSISRFLTKQGSAIARQAAEHYSQFTKGAEDDAKRIAEILQELDLDWVQVTGMMTQPLTETAREAATNVLLELGFTDEDGELFGVVNQDALNYAQDRGAEMVGMKFVNGELVENPDAAWAITDTTRDELRQLISKAFSDGMSPADLETAIEDSFQFSSARAEMIARTEMSKAHIAGALDAAKASGLVEKKFTMLSADHDLDDECDDNEAEGEIDLDDDFPSGDDGPPFHPNCFASGTIVSASGITAQSKRWFHGEVVKILISPENELTVTPNHPILTRRGWVAAGELKQGARRFRRRGTDRVTAVNGRHLRCLLLARARPWLPPLARSLFPGTKPNLTGTVGRC